jgi:predicted phage-related endonuclease
VTTKEERFSPEYMRTHIGASDVPAALGLDPYKRPIELWEEMTGLRERAPGGEMAELGNALEPSLVRWASGRIGHDVKHNASDTFEHAHEPGLCCTPDGFDDSGAGVVVQCKVSGMGSMRREELEARWGDDGTSDVPLWVAAQVQAEMAVLRSHGLPVASVHVAAWLGHVGRMLYVVPFVPEISDGIVAKCARFIAHVREGIPPPVDDSEAYADFLERRFPQARGREIQADPFQATVAAAFIAANKARKDAEKAERFARSSLEALMMDATSIAGDFGKVRWDNRAGREALDVEGLLADLADIVGRERVEKLRAVHTARGKGHRAMTAYARKDA